MTKDKKLSVHNGDVSLWPRPADSEIPQPRERFFSIERALTLRFQGFPDKEVSAETGISAGNLSRLARRALLTNPATGEINGLYVALKYFRAPGIRRRRSPPTRKSKEETGEAGEDAVAHSSSDLGQETRSDADRPKNTQRGYAWSLINFFEKNPRIEKIVVDSFLRRGEFKAETKASAAVIARRMRAAALEDGVSEEEWPFCVDDRGYEAVRRFGLELLNSHTRPYIKARHGKQAARNYEKERPGLNIFEHMPMLSVRQVDFHSWDGNTVLHVVDPRGCDMTLPVCRFHVGIMIDEDPGALHGYVLVFELTPSADAFLEIIASALTPLPPVVGDGVPISLTPAGNFVISKIVPELAANAFAVLRTDNAYAMICEDSIGNTMDVTGCIFELGAVYSWWIRGKIERFNAHFERLTGHRLPSTLGTGPRDPMRDEPVRNALGFDVRLEQVVEAIDAFVEDHNRGYVGRPTHGQTIENIVRTNLNNPSSGVFARPLPKTGHDDWTLLANLRIATVRAYPSRGVAPHLVAANCRYKLEGHEHRFDLNKSLVYVAIYRPNANIAIAIVVATNEYLGYLTPERLWRRAPVSLWMRNKLSKFVKRARSRQGNQNPWDAYVDSIGKKVASGEATPTTVLEIAKLKQHQERVTRLEVPEQAAPDRVDPTDPPERSVRTLGSFRKKLIDIPVTALHGAMKRNSNW
ncbi:hypothetical protein LJR034_005177 [Caballeronia sp. LjRoot34]|uniref:hypothetical protein n=1 Tax=Caballeronia sp. LjRoot34 TaxID=3342325 RepID=UPI003ECE930B